MPPRIIEFLGRELRRWAGLLPGPEIEASVGGKASAGRTEIEISVGGKTGGKNENIGPKILEKRDLTFIAIKRALIS
jgi:hypothetical protein